MITSLIMALSITITRPPLYAKQAAFVDDPARYCACEASTKSGKTVGCMVWLLDHAINRGGKGRNFWWVAPTYQQSSIAYVRMARWLQECGLPAGIIRLTESRQTIRLANGSIIWFKGADNEDSLYGEDVYAAVVDEASRCTEAAWFALRSTLTATRGPVKLIGNVKGTANWFYRACRKAQNGEQNWSYHKITAWDAVEGGVLDSAEIEDARRTLPDWAFRELYLAEASDSIHAFFDGSFIRRLRASGELRPPMYYGYVDAAGFRSGSEASPLRWWGPMENGRPLQNHNYCGFADVSFGLGSSNSALPIADDNGEVVGLWCDSRTPPHLFAAAAVHLCKWVGGSRPCLLGWEANGGGGLAFGQEVHRLGWGVVLGNPDTAKPWKPDDDKIGWWSTRDRKEGLLGTFYSTLARGAMTLHDSATVDEMELYTCYENGEIGPAELVEESGGARRAHGDRVIATAGLTLCLEHLSHFKPAPKPVPLVSFGSRFQQWEREQARQSEW